MQEKCVLENRNSVENQTGWGVFAKTGAGGKDQFVEA